METGKRNAMEKFLRIERKRAKKKPRLVAGVTLTTSGSTVIWTFKDNRKIKDKRYLHFLCNELECGGMQTVPDHSERFANPS